MCSFRRNFFLLSSCGWVSAAVEKAIRKRLYQFTLSTSPRRCPFRCSAESIFTATPEGSGKEPNGTVDSEERGGYDTASSTATPSTQAPTLEVRPQHAKIGAMYLSFALYLFFWRIPFLPGGRGFSTFATQKITPTIPFPKQKKIVRNKCRTHASGLPYVQLVKHKYQLCLVTSWVEFTSTML